MREGPILFKDEMVCSILRGQKIHTRRFSGLEDVNKNPYAWTFKKLDHLDYMTKPSAKGKYGAYFESGLIEPHTLSICPQVCPYGEPGDRLWVRETWRAEELESGQDGVRYAADNLFRPIENTREAAEAWGNAYFDKHGEPRNPLAWRPSIFMPRWASRTMLEIVNIRVERIMDISEQDALYEGVTRQMRTEFGYSVEESQETFNFTQARSTFKLLWDSINAARGFGWDVNPFVWVVEFRRL